MRYPSATPALSAWAPPLQPPLNVSSAPTLVLDEAALQRLRELDPTGQNHLLERVLRAFETSVARLSPQLAESRVRGDMHGIRHVAHTLKSSSASIGALHLSRLCAEIEAVVRQEAPAALSNMLDDMDRELNDVLQAVKLLRDTAQ